MSKGDDIQERMIDFSVGVMQLCEALPETPSGRHIASQLLRCGTSPASNYAEARAGESKRDFLHKLGVVMKELNESIVWLETARRGSLGDAAEISALLGEGRQLARIIAASIATAKGPRKG